MDEREVLARSMPPPVDMAVDGNFAGKVTPPFLHELRGWTGLPLAALALAGLLALLLAASRVPGAEQVLTWTGDSFFQKGLVAHVTFAFVIWYMGVHGALTVIMTAQMQDARDPPGLFNVLTGRLGLYGAGVSLILLLAPVLADLGEPSLNNYLPVLDHPVYYAGLLLLAVSVALPVVRLLVILARERKCDAAVFAIAAAGVIYLLALACVLAAWLTIPPNVGRQGTNEYLMWGGGHVLQFANTALMLCAFYLIARAALGETPLPGSWLKIMMLVLVAGAAAGPLLYLTHEPGGATQRDLFTRLYWYALPLPTAVVLGSVALLLMRRWRDAMNGPPEIKAVVIAFVLFAYGGVLGFFEGSIDTRTPSHYHAMLIAVSLAFMALYFALFLPLLGRRTARRKLRTVMYVLLGGGQFLHSTGLYLAGLEGVLRKTPGAAQGLDSTWKIVSMSMMGVGGLIAVAGGIIFIFLAGKMLLAKPDHRIRPAP
ncbi:MAG: cbb3-type cytochrome c oxidase subunit I [Rhodospirillaceae bacterium]